MLNEVVLVAAVVDGWGVHFDALSSDDSADLGSDYVSDDKIDRLTLSLKLSKSAGIMVSALAMTGMRLTRVPRRFMISTSRGLTLGSVRPMVYCLLGDARQSAGLEEVKTSMDPQVLLVGTKRLLLLAHEGLMLVVDEINDRRPAIAIVDVVAEARCVDDRELISGLYSIPL